ncbi:hypothetical protein D3C71_153950 [compost metagenome]
MTAEVFDVDSYLKDFGKLSYTPLVTPKATLTLEPGLRERGTPAFDEDSMRAYPRMILRDIFPTKLPAEMLPRMVEPSFAWDAKVQRARLAQAILESDIVYDESGTIEDIDDIASVVWDRLHAAYLLNEIAPDKEVTIISPSDDSRDFFVTLLAEDDSRTVTAHDWLEEMRPLARMHFSFFTNMIVLGKTLYDGCSRPETTSAFIELLHPDVRSVASKHVNRAHSSINFYHANCIDIVGAFAESTDEQRRNLFHQFIKAREVADVRPTLGSRFMSGYKTASSGLHREISHPVEYISLLAARGFIAPDLDRKSFDITPGGWQAIETLKKCPDLIEYQTLVTDISAGVRPISDADAVEPWIIGYFEALKRALASREELEPTSA